MKGMERKVIFFITLSVLVFGIPALGCAASDSGLNKKERIILHQARKALDKDELDKSRNIVMSYLQEDPKNVSPQIFLFLGNIWHQKDKPDRARKAYKKGLQSNASNVSLHLNYAVSCYQTQKYQESGKHFQMAYDLQKNSNKESESKLLYKSASAYYQGQEYTAVKKVLNKLLSESDQVSQDWLTLLVQTHINLKEWNKAEKIANRLIDKDPLNKKYWRILSKCNFQQEDYSSAASNLEIAYYIEAPEDLSQWKQLADIYLYLNAPLKAARFYKKGNGKSVSAKEYEKLADIYSQALRYGKAIEYMDKALQKEASAERYLKKGNYYYEQRKFDRAIDCFQKSAQLDSSKGKVHLLTGFAACEIDRWELAKKSFQKASGFDQYRSWAKGGLAFVQDILEAKKAASQEMVLAQN